MKRTVVSLGVCRSSGTFSHTYNTGPGKPVISSFEEPAQNGLASGGQVRGVSRSIGAAGSGLCASKHSGLEQSPHADVRLCRNVVPRPLSPEGAIKSFEKRLRPIFAPRHEDPKVTRCPTGECSAMPMSPCSNIGCPESSTPAANENVHAPAISLLRTTILELLVLDKTKLTNRSGRCQVTLPAVP